MKVLLQGRTVMTGTAGITEALPTGVQVGHEVQASHIGDSGNYTLTGLVDAGTNLVLGAHESAILTWIGDATGWVSSWTSDKATVAAVAAGEGDFKSDGTVAMTGDLYLGGNDLGNVGTVNADTVKANTVVDLATGTGPSIDLSSSEVKVSGKGTLQIPLAVDGVSGISVPLQEWRVNHIGLTTIGPTGGFTGPEVVADQIILPDAGAPVDAVASSKVLNSAAPNADLTLTAKTKGNLSPPVTITIVVGAALAPLSILTTGLGIVVTLASTDGIVGTSVANGVKGIIDGDAGGAADLVTVAVEGSGAGLVDAFSIQSLASGVDGTPGQMNQIIANNGIPYFCTAIATTATAGAWKKMTLESLT